MKIAIITGSSGLVGSQAVRHFAGLGYTVIGIDNDMRRYFFGDDASTHKSKESLEQTVKNYKHKEMDIRDLEGIGVLFKEYATDIQLVIHAAAQPSHDWAAKEPLTDFHVNATGTLNLLEASRLYCPEAVFIFMSTNKVYGGFAQCLTFNREGNALGIARGSHVLSRD